MLPSCTGRPTPTLFAPLRQICDGSPYTSQPSENRPFPMAVRARGSSATLRHFRYFTSCFRKRLWRPIPSGILLYQTFNIRAVPARSDDSSFRSLITHCSRSSAGYARRARYCCTNSVRLSVRLSHEGIVSKRMHITSHFLTLGRSIILVIEAQRRYKIPRGIPSAGALN